MKRQRFDLDAEIQKAWDWCWNYYCEASEYREEIYDKDGFPTGKFKKEVRIIPARQSWLTATDLERRVRAAAAEALQGKPYGSIGADVWGEGVRVSGGNGISLLEAVRNWLSQQAARGVLARHNFGRGHCSRMRYRPVGVPLTEAEQKTAEKKAKPYSSKPVHFADPAVKSWPALSLCSAKARATVRASSFGYSRGSNRSSTRTTKKAEEVTCPRCLKLLAEKKAVAHV